MREIPVAMIEKAGDRPSTSERSQGRLMINKVVAVVVMVGLIAAGGCTTNWFSLGASTKLPRPVQEFVSLRFVDRWPVVEAYRYGSDAPARSAAVKTLEGILEDSRQKSAWAHSVATLGFVGGDKAGIVIFNFITRLQKLTSFSLYEQRAMHSGVVALGTWAWTSKYRPDLGFGGPRVQSAITALEIYVKGCGNFYSHLIHSTIPIFCPAVSDSVLHREFAQAALWGLALSGDQTAGMTLQEFARAMDGDPAVKSFIPEAQAAHARVTRVGLLCYYEPYSVECQQMAGRR